MKRLSTLLGTLVVSSSLWAADIEIQTPYARAVPPGQPNSAAFMQLINRGQEAVALIGARSEASRVVELHTHTQEQGVMRMRQIKRIELPAGERVDLQPGGLHLMLIGLQAPPVRGTATGDDTGVFRWQRTATPGAGSAGDAGINERAPLSAAHQQSLQPRRRASKWLYTFRQTSFSTPSPR